MKLDRKFCKGQKKEIIVFWSRWRRHVLSVYISLWGMCLDLLLHLMAFCIQVLLKHELNLAGHESDSLENDAQFIFVQKAE